MLSVLSIRFTQDENIVNLSSLISQLLFANLPLSSQSAKYSSPTFRFTKCWIYKKEIDICSQKFINGLALAEPTTCTYPNWAVRFFSTSVPVLEYRRLSTAVLARKYRSSVNLFRTKRLIKSKETLCHRQPIYELS